MDNQKQDHAKKGNIESYESKIRNSKKKPTVLKLYVAGSTSRSLAAIANIRQICETHLQNRYSLEVIDIYQQPSKVREDQIIAAPTLIKLLPLPLRRIIGDLSSEERILVAIDLSDQDVQMMNHNTEPAEE